jgi:hypothetical protein
MLRHGVSAPQNRLFAAVRPGAARPALEGACLMTVSTARRSTKTAQWAAALRKWRPFRDGSTHEPPERFVQLPSASQSPAVSNHDWLSVRGSRLAALGEA